MKNILIIVEGMQFGGLTFGSNHIFNGIVRGGCHICCKENKALGPNQLFKIHIGLSLVEDLSVQIFSLLFSKSSPSWLGRICVNYVLLELGRVTMSIQAVFLSVKKIIFE
jgi:hypothetical protein